MVLMVTMFSTIAVSLPYNELNRKEIKTNHQQIISQDHEIDVKIIPAAGFIGYDVDITNNADSVIMDINYKVRTKAAITGTGFLINELIQQNSIDEIQPGETITLIFRPLTSPSKSPLGFGNLYMDVRISYDDVIVRSQQRSVLFFVFIFDYKDTYMDISADVAYEMILAEEFELIIDVVGLDIYQQGHLPDAVNYVWANGELQQMIPTLDAEKTYLVYCHTDPPSTAGAQALVNAGIVNTYRLEGNYGAWVNAGYPIET